MVGTLYEKNSLLRHDSIIRSEIFSAERLEQHAESLAAAQKIARHPPQARLLEKRLRANDHVLRDIYRKIGKAIGEASELPPAAEWLVDNYFILEEQIRDIRNDLPPQYYAQLPKLADGYLTGYPRVYGIAWAYIAHTDSFFNPGLLERFIRAYQRIQPLNIGELWAVSISLRIALVENLRRAGALIIADRQARAEADLLADRLLVFADTHAATLDGPLQEIADAQPFLGFFGAIDPAFARSGAACRAAARMPRGKTAQAGHVGRGNRPCRTPKSGRADRDCAQHHHQHALPLDFRLGAVFSKASAWSMKNSAPPAISPLWTCRRAICTAAPSNVWRAVPTCRNSM